MIATRHLLLVALLATPALSQRIEDGVISYPDGFTMELGVPGELPPPATGAAPLLVHGDTTGGADQALLELAAGAGGFSAAWSDMRDGNRGLFVGHLAADGKTPIDGAPVHLPRSSRQGAPRLALVGGAPDGQRMGAVAWLAADMTGDFVMLRGIGPEGEAGVERGGAAALLDLPRHLAKMARGSAPRLVLGPGGSGLVAWLDGDRLVGRLLAPNAATGKLRPAPPRVLVGGLAPAGGRYELAVGPKGQALLVWAEQAAATPGDDLPPTMTRALVLDLKQPDEVRLAPLGGEPSEGEAPVIELGEGRPLELAVGSEGFWLARLHAEGLALELLSPTGTIARPAVLVTGDTVTEADLTTWSDGKAAAILVETPIERDDPGPHPSAVGRVALHVFGMELERVTPPVGLEVLDADAVDARGPRVAALGTRFLVGWTDERTGHRDVWFRMLDLADMEAPAQRWNQDDASSSQAHAAVASDGKRQAAVAWEDERDGTARIWTRALYLGKDGALGPGPEGPVDPGGTERCAFPTLAVAPSGDRLVVWKEQLDKSWILRGRALAGNGEPRGPAMDLDPGHTTAHTWPAAAVALPGGAGYAVAWIRPDEGPVLSRIGPDGRPIGRPLLLVPSAMGPEADPRNVDLERLDDGRLVVAWDQLAPPRRAGRKPLPPGAPPLPPARQLFGRVIDAAGTAPAKPQPLGRSPMGGDHDPALAATPGGGFLVAWTANDGPARDVFAQAFDRFGRPADPMLAVSVKAHEQDFADALRLEDGRILVAWEDDISGRDHCFARALDTRKPSARKYPTNQRPPRGELQPRALLNDLETVYVEDRHAPRVAPMEGGYLAVWDDLARGHGHDVVARWFALP